MPRPARLVVAGHAHHVIQRGNNRQPIFLEDADRLFFRATLKHALTAHGCVLHAYVLMTNHIHFLITPDHEAAIGALMQSLGRRYVGYFNRTHGRTGTLWEGRFKSTVVDTEGYVLACYRYIEANPVRAGMVSRAAEYSWSSHGLNAIGAPDALIGEHPCYHALGAGPDARREAYRALFDETLRPELVDTLRDATQRGWVPGREAFRRQIEQQLGRRLGPPVRGRPPKMQNDEGTGAGK